MHPEDPAWKTITVQMMKRKAFLKWLVWFVMKTDTRQGTGLLIRNLKSTLYFYNFRVILVGGGGVGKTSLQEKFLSPENSQFYESVYGNHLFTFIRIVYLYRMHAFQEIQKLSNLMQYWI